MAKLTSRAASALDDAFERAEKCQASCKRQSASRQSPVRAAGGGNSLSIDAMGAERASDQLLAFRDWVYTGLNPICKRIAGQPIQVAKISGRKKRERPQKPGGQPEKPSRKPKSALALERLRRKTPAYLHKQIDKLEPLDGHAILDLIRDPNDLMVSWSLIYFTVANLLLTGKAYWWIVKGRGGQAELWPLPSSWVMPVHDQEQLFTSWQVLAGGAGPAIEVPTDEVVYFNLPDPSDPIGGLGPIQAAARAIETDRSIQTAQSQGYKNGIFPNYAVMIGDTATPGGDMARPELTGEQRQQIVSAVRRMIGGVARAGEPLILDAIVRDFKKISASPQEMDFLASGQHTKDRILQTIGTNPIIVGQVEAGSRAASAMADHHFCQSTVNPLIELLSQAMTAWLAPMFAAGDELAVWIEPARPHDTEERRAEISMLTQVGGITVEEMREAFGYDPEMRPDDTVLMPMSLTPVKAKDLDKIAAAATEQGGAFGPPNPMPMFPGMGGPLRPDGAPNDGSGDGRPQDADGKKLPQPEGQPEPGEEPGRDKSLARNRAARVAYKSYWLKAHTRQENVLASAARALFRAQLEEILPRFSNAWREYAYSGQPPEQIAELIAERCFQPGEWRQRMLSAMRPVLRRAAATGAAIEVGAQRQRKQHHANGVKAEIAGVPWMQIPPEVMEYIEDALDDSLALPYWQDINLTTRQQLQALLTDAIAEGKRADSIADDITDLLGGSIAQRRAQNIARTETTGAINAGHWAVRQSLIDEGLIQGSQWVTMLDDKVRPTHDELEEQTVGPGQLFDVGGYPAPYPGYPGLPAEERCQCRCTTIAVDVGDLEDFDPSDMEGQEFMEDAESTVGDEFTDDELAELEELADDEWDKAASLPQPLGFWSPKNCGAGDAGSPGFQPGNSCGRGEGGGGGDAPDEVSNETVGRLVEQIAATGGFTFRPQKGSPDAGYMVSQSESRTRRIPENKFVNSDVHQYFADHADALKDDNAYYGAWIDDETGEVCFDIAHHYNDESDAERIAIEHTQKSYYDIANGRVVDVQSKWPSSEKAGCESRQALHSHHLSQRRNARSGIRSDHGGVAGATRAAGRQGACEAGRVMPSGVDLSALDAIIQFASRAGG